MFTDSFARMLIERIVTRSSRKRVLFPLPVSRPRLRTPKRTPTRIVSSQRQKQPRKGPRLKQRLQQKPSRCRPMQKPKQRESRQRSIPKFTIHLRVRWRCAVWKYSGSKRMVPRRCLSHNRTLASVARWHSEWLRLWGRKRRHKNSGYSAFVLLACCTVL